MNLRLQGFFQLYTLCVTCPTKSCKLSHRLRCNSNIHCGRCCWCNLSGIDVTRPAWPVSVPHYMTLGSRQGAEGTLTISYAMLTIVFYLLGSLRHRSAEDYNQKRYLWAVNSIEKERDNHITISQFDITSSEILFLAPTFFVTNHHFHKQDCDIELIL